MTTTDRSAAGISTRELVITRVFDAPRELVFQAWTDPRMLVRWWGPKTYTSPVCKVDLRVGGSYHFCMRTPGGQEIWSTGVYHEIVPPERLVMTDSFADEHGNVVPWSHYGVTGDWPLEILLTLTLDEHDGKTTMTLRQEGFPVSRLGDRAEAGWNESFDKFADFLADG